MDNQSIPHMPYKNKMCYSDNIYSLLQLLSVTFYYIIRFDLLISLYQYYNCCS
jgi:hypothetical protein